MPDWFDRLPKTEIHVHLEGAIPPTALRELVKKYGGDPARTLAFRDFPGFVQAWLWQGSFLREADDYRLIAEAFARSLAAQNIRYAEVFYSPVSASLKTLTLPAATEAVRAGLSRVPGVEVALVADLIRGLGPADALARLAALKEVRGLGVIGIGLGGLEGAFPSEAFAPVYAEARRLGFRTTAHAGETMGPGSIVGALEDLQVERIGHGTRAGEDERLMDLLAERQIPLEVCLTSNLRLRIVKDLKAHPIRRFVERGLLVTVNTDDPTMFGCTLAGEYRMLEKELGFSREQIRGLVLGGIEATWLPEARKREMKAAFQVDPGWQ